MATALSICSSALLMLNEDEITSFEDETRESKLCAALYETTRDSMLQMHPWRFSLNQTRLARLADAPLFEFANAFQLPSNTLRVIAVDNTSFNFKIFEDMIYSDANEISVTIQFIPREEDMPAYFVRTLEFAMAEVLASALIADESKMQIFENKKIQQIRAARSIDSQNQPSLTFADNNFLLTNVRT